MKLDSVRSGGARGLREGYTTGSCAAAAAKTAAGALLGEKTPAAQQVTAPDGSVFLLPVEWAAASGSSAQAAVRKDAGDDPDVTDGVLVCARVRLAEQAAIVIDGGEGVGRVTRAGLDQPVGAAAINRVPREMITQAVREVLDAHGWTQGALVSISIPGGEQLAARTYNPRLGIIGGLSILGTTGIVKPMSEAALVETIYTELNMLRADGGGTAVLTPGNYGEQFCREALGIPSNRVALCSNFLGEAVDYAAGRGFGGILLVGHIGKLVKLAGGIFQTHSRVADARMEILTAHAALAGASPALAAALLRECATTDAAVALLEQEGILSKVVASLLEKCGEHLSRRAGETPAGVVLFSSGQRILGMTEVARRQVMELQKEKTE